VNEPMTGELLIKKCAVDIKSIELQLVRVESCTYMEGEAREGNEQKKKMNYEIFFSFIQYLKFHVEFFFFCTFLFFSY
jgi:hypothetical protein